MTMHAVPRSLFDLIPGEAKSVPGRDGAFTFWTKDVMLAGEPGKHLPLTVYCSEPPLSEIEPVVAVWHSQA